MCNNTKLFFTRKLIRISLEELLKIQVHVHMQLLNVTIYQTSFHLLRALLLHSGTQGFC